MGLPNGVNPVPVDDDLMLSVIEHESGGRSNAVSEAGAQGLSQIMPANSEKLGLDPHDDVENVMSGLILLGDEMRHYKGDERFALAAYNAGRPAVEAAIKRAKSFDFEKVYPELPEETRAYVPAVISSYEARKGTRLEKSIEQKNSPANYNEPWGTPKDFANAVTDLTTSPDFDSLRAPERVQRLSRILDSRKWVPEVDEHAKQVADALWTGADEGEKPPLGEVLGPYLANVTGETKEDVDKSSTAAQNLFTTTLREGGINPAVYGSQIDQAFGNYAADQTAAAESRNRGVVGTAIAAGKELLRGAAEGYTGAAAAVPDLLGYEGAGKAVREGAKNLLGENREFDYETNPDGSIKLDEFGNPTPAYAGSILRGLGQAASLFAGGGLLKAGGYSLRAIGAAMGGTNALFAADAAYSEAREEGAGRDDALIGALTTLPLSAAATALDASVFATGRHEFAGLTGLNRVKAIAALAVESGAKAGAGGAAAETGIEAGVSAATGENRFSGRKIATAAGVGAVVGAGVGTIEGAYGDTTPKPPVYTIPNRTGTRVNLPAPAVRLGLPAPETRLGLPAPENRGLPPPSSGPAVRIGPTVSPDEAVQLNQKLEAFQHSNDKQIVINFPNEKEIPQGLLNLFGYEAQRLSSEEVAIFKRESYEPPEIDRTSLDALNDRIQTVSADLDSLPHPDTAAELVDQRSQLKREYYSLEKDLGREIVDTNSLATLRRNTQKEINANRVERKRNEDPTIRKVLDLEYVDLKSRFDQIQEGLSQNKQKARAVDVRSEIADLNDKIKQVTEPLYANNYAARQRELHELLSDRATLAKTKSTFVHEDHYKEGSLKIETPFGDRFALPFKGKWYVLDSSGTPLTGGDWTLKTALSAARQVDDLRFTPPEVRPLGPSFSKREPVGSGLKQTLTFKRGAVKEILPKKGKMRFTTPPKAKKGRAAEQSFSGLNASPDDAVGGPGSPTGNEAGAINPQLRTSADESLNRIRQSKSQKPVSNEFTSQPEPTLTGQKPISIRDVVKKGRDVLKAIDSKNPIGFIEGGRSMRGTRGFFAISKDYLKGGRINNIPTMIHEVAHALSKYTFLNKELPPAVETGLRETAETYYPGGAGLGKKLQVNEGFSMFIQHLTTGQKIHRDVKTWFDSTFAKDYPAEYKAVQDFKSLVTDYRNQSPQMAIRQARSAKPVGKADKIVSAVKNFYSDWVDAAAPLKKLDNVAGSRLADEFEARDKNSSVLSKNMLLNEAQDLNGNALPDITPVGEILKGVEKRGQLDDFIDYISALSLQNQYVKQGLEPGGGVSIPDIDQAIRQIESKHPDIAIEANKFFDSWQQQFRAVANWSSIVSRMTDIIEGNNLKSTGARHGYYLPIFREGKEAGIRLGARKSGSYRRFENPLSHLQDVMTAHIRSTERLGMMERILDKGSLLDNSPVAHFITEITDAQTRDKLKQNHAEQVSKYMENLEGSKDSNEFANLAVGLLSMGGKKQGAADGYHILTVPTEHGNRYFEVADELYNVFSPEALGVGDNAAMQMAKASTRFFKTGATAARPAFAAFNLLRDATALWRRIDTNNPVAFLSYAMEGLMNVSADKLGIESMSKWVKAAQRAGFEASTRFSGELYDGKIKSAGHKLVDIPGKTLKQLEEVIGIGERGLRVAGYIAKAKEMGLSHDSVLTRDQAIDLFLAPRRSTTNFAVQGTTARRVNQLTPFFTARIAEVDQFVKDFKRHPGKTSAYVGGMLAYGISHYLANKDERWNQELTPEERMKFVHLPIEKDGDKRLLRIPLDSLGGFGFMIGQAIASSMDRQNMMKPGVSEMLGAMVKNIGPVDVSLENPRSFIESLSNFASPAVREGIQQLANKDFYFEKPIVPGSVEHSPAKDQVTQYTTDTAKKLADYVAPMIDVSPVRLEHAIRSTFPAAMDAVHFYENVTGKSNLKISSDRVASTKDLLGNFYLRHGLANDVVDRSLQKVYDASGQLEGGKATESEADEKKRKKVDTVVEKLSAISTVISAGVSKEYRDKLLETKTKLIDEGLQIISGESETKLEQAPTGAAKGIKRQRKRTANEAKTAARQNQPSNP